jgi:hypothetical protein
VHCEGASACEAPIVCKDTADVCSVTCQGEGACKSGVCCTPASCRVAGAGIKC